MDRRSLRIDDPAALKSHVEGLKRGAEIAIDIPVEVSAQDSRDVAYSVFDAAFVAEALAWAFEQPALTIEKDPADPNADLVRLMGAMRHPSRVIGFLDDWFETLDANGTGEPFLESEEAERLFDRMDSEEDPSRFRWPELVKWFRIVRAQFDESDADADFDDT